MSEIYSYASRVWSGMSVFRSERARCKRYVYGDQWEDILTLGQQTMTEREFIRRQGQEPLKNNILRRILRNVVGLYRSQYKVPALSRGENGLCGMRLREANRRRREWFYQNRMEELSPRLLEEFLISGLVAVKVTDGKILPVTPDNFFFHSDGYDPLGRDVDLIGEVHYVGFGRLLEHFCRDDACFRRLSELYGHGGSASAACKVTEIWYKDTRVFGILHDERKASLSLARMEDVMLETEKSARDSARRTVKGVVRHEWRRMWFASDGSLLAESDSAPMHPYVFKAYPFIDGEIHSYISDIIDQQRYVNRLITLYDFIMKSSAKGVLLFPDESIPSGMDLQEVAEEWSRFNGVIPYRARPGVPLPTQVSGNAANIGITDLLKIEMQMLEDISGVSPTLQGKLETNATSGTLFARQNEAAQTSLLDVIRSFTDFLSSVADLTPRQ
ncbi:MAG: hypothetical protein K2K45_06915 [Muribaculaceae bacterium]|nr:hypothetical protein [Muribaculaceae bacterium]